jgi:PAS domain S-box-containing protein
MRNALKRWVPTASVSEVERPWQARYAITLLAIVGATALRVPLNSLLGLSVPFILYFPAVVFAAWYGGFRCGLLATALGALAANFFWMHPRFSLGLPGTTDIVQLALFVALSIFTTWLTGMLHATASSLRKAHLDIRTQAERFYVTLSSIGDAVMATDTEGKIQFMNPAAEELTGWTFAEADGKSVSSVFRLIHEHTRKPIDNPVYTALRENRKISLTNDIVLLTKEGTGRAIEDTAAPIVDNGVLLGVVLVFHDVTSRREAGRKLEEAHRRIEEIMSRMSDGFAIFDRDWRYVYVNDRGAEIAGKGRGQLLGKRLWDLFPDEVGQPSYEQLTRAMQENSSVHFETFYQPFGKWFDLRAHPSTEGLALYIADITEKKNIQLAVTQQLEKRVADKTKELKERNTTLEGLSYGLAHDLRAPLRAIEGFTRILLEEFSTPLGEQGKEFCEKINNSATHAEKLMSDLLEYGRLAHAVLPLKAVDLDAAVSAALRQLDHEIREKVAVVEVAQPLPAVVANSTVLEQTLANLVSNALKFRRADAPPRIQIRADELTSSVKVHVIDNGIGIAPENIERIFKAFERLHGRDQYPGTGLGLSIVQTGVERMGGRVGVTSEFGHGSQFWIELPKPDGVFPPKPVPSEKAIG